MNQNIIRAKELMEKGWKAREDHHFEEAEKLLNEAKEIFENEKDWFNVTECLNHLSYNKKIQGEKLLLEGYELSKEALDTAKKYGTKTVLIYRSLLSLAMSLGMFEISSKYSKEFMEQMKSEADRADVLTHIAMINLRTGKINEAEKTIAEAKMLLDKNFETVTEPHRFIWKTKTLLAEALILLNQGNLDKASNIAQEALKIAKDNNLKTRVDQANQIITALDEIQK